MLEGRKDIQKTFKKKIYAAVVMQFFCRNIDSKAE